MTDTYTLDHEEWIKNGVKFKDGFVLSCTRGVADPSIGDKIYIKSDDLKKVAKLLKDEVKDD